MSNTGGVLNTRMWVAPPTKMDRDQLTEEGYYFTYGKAGVRIETPGCSLCMGNQARVAEKVNGAVYVNAKLPKSFGYRG